MVLAAAICAATATGDAAHAQFTAPVRISEGPGGLAADADSGVDYATGASVSGDGRFVAFESSATNLLSSPDRNRGTDVFVLERDSGRLRLASVGPRNAQLREATSRPSISRDGRLVAMQGALDVIVRDVERRRTVRVNLERRDPSVRCEEPVMSANGRYIAFAASRSEGGRNRVDIGLFVHDLRRHETRRIVGRPKAPSVVSYSLSANGRHLAVSYGARAVVRDLRSGKEDTIASVRRTRHDSIGDAVISGNGRFVAFRSDEANRVTERMYVRDLKRRRTELVSLDPSEGAYATDAVGPAISHDGRYVSFVVLPPEADGFVGHGGDDASPYGDVMLRDRKTGTTIALSNDHAGLPSGRSGWPAMSADGKTIAFTSGAPLEADDTNSAMDLYAVER